MTAQSAPRGNGQLQGPDLFGPYPVLAGAKIYDGALVSKLPSETVEAPPAAPTAALDTGVPGNIDNGSHVYAVTEVTTGGETTPSVISNSITIADKTVAGKALLTAIAVGSENAAARNLYRSKAGTTTPLFLVATIADNTTTTYTDNVADSALGAAAPSANTAVILGGGYAQPANHALGDEQVVCGVAAPVDYVSNAEGGQPTTYGTDPRLVVDNTTGADGDLSIMCRKGVFRFKNKGGDLVTNLMINEDCYIEDDQTVRATASGTSKAGKVVQLADDGSGDVYVQIIGYGRVV